MPLDWTLLAPGLVVLGLWLLVREIRKPRVMVTVQKVTNQNSGETVTVQANTRRTSVAAIFDTIDRAATAAVARMHFVNEEILAETAKQQAGIQARVAARRVERDQLVEKRARRKLARRLGIPIEQVTEEMVRERIAARNGTPVAVAAAEGAE